MPASDLVTVAVFGHPDADIGAKLLWPDAWPEEAKGFEVSVHADDRELAKTLVESRPHVFLSFGAIEAYPRLLAAPLEIRRRWIHHAEPPEPEVLARQVLNAYVDVATNDRFPAEPLVSVFTPTYKTGERLERPFRSLQAQTYRNWEWVLYDDSPSSDEDTWRRLQAVAKEEPRARIFRSDGNWGSIGEVKRRLCGLARGKILVELDHDDELTDHCLADVLDGFRAFPDAGFVYTDCAELFEDGEPATYGDSYAFGFGSYRRETYRGRELFVTNYPSVNSKTIRHIVGVPNHVRAWKREAYDAIGGYAPEIHVADDYELLVRTFLKTRMVHVQRLGYLQYIQRGGGNTQRVRNKEIQRLVRLFHLRYEDEIHARFEELGVDDFLRKNGALDWDMKNPDPAPIANYVLKDGPPPVEA